MPVLPHRRPRKVLPALLAVLTAVAVANIQAHRPAPDLALGACPRVGTAPMPVACVPLSGR